MSNKTNVSLNFELPELPIKVAFLMDTFSDWGRRHQKPILFQDVPIDEGGGIIDIAMKKQFLNVSDSSYFFRCFLAPFDGIYRFSFSGTSDSEGRPDLEGLKIEVRKGQKTQFLISDEDWSESGRNVAATWIWYMEKGEILDFNVINGVVYVSEDWPLTITGELIGLL